MEGVKERVWCDVVWCGVAYLVVVIVGDGGGPGSVVPL